MNIDRENRRRFKNEGNLFEWNGRIAATYNPLAA